jgi:hypothetical protein
MSGSARLGIAAAAIVLAVGCGGRHLPPYARRQVAPEPASELPSSGVEVPPPPVRGPLRLEDVATVGVRIEYDGLEQGPHGASQPLAAQVFEPSHARFFRTLEERSRGRVARLGPARGGEDLEVLVVVLGFRLRPQHCETTRTVTCTTDSDGDRDCDTDYDTDCEWPVDLYADAHVSRPGETATVRTLTAQNATEGDLPSAIDAMFDELATRLVQSLAEGGLP